ncbi:MAG TPA: phosphate-starvation-inducible PsiE family protein [Nitrospiria bacterium]|nr:phosphate-starvation-inducible PsiE family protein [Nitrospiria bacterium]
MQLTKDESMRQFPVWIARIGQGVYILVAVSFLIAAVVALVFAWIGFFHGLSRGVLPAIVNLINDALLILIILEVLETILNYLKSHILLLEPFLYIGIIAAIRRILATGSYISFLEGNINKDLLVAYLSDLGMNTLVIAVLVAALYILSKIREQPGLRDSPQPR